MNYLLLVTVNYGKFNMKAITYHNILSMTRRVTQSSSPSSFQGLGHENKDIHKVTMKLKYLLFLKVPNEHQDNFSILSLLYSKGYSYAT